MQQQYGFQMLPWQMWLHFWIPLREKKTRGRQPVVSLASAASVGHLHCSCGTLASYFATLKILALTEFSGGKGWEESSGRQWQCMCQGRNLSPANFQASKWKHNPYLVRRMSFTQPFMKMNSWIKTIWVVQRDPVILPKVSAFLLQTCSSCCTDTHLHCQYVVLLGGSGGYLHVLVEWALSDSWAIRERAWIMIITTINGFLFKWQYSLPNMFTYRILIKGQC